MLKGIVTDIDGTLTDKRRRLSTEAITLIRSLIDEGISVAFASGNTACFLDTFSRMIGTEGAFIGENGGIYRTGNEKEIRIRGDLTICKEAFTILTEYYQDRGIQLSALDLEYRFSDLAFPRIVPVEEVQEILSGFPIEVVDTGFALHLHTPGITKGSALREFAKECGLRPSDFLAIGDGLNDTEMLREAGVGITVANADPRTKEVATFVSEKSYGDGFVECITRYSPYFLSR